MPDLPNDPPIPTPPATPATPEKPRPKVNVTPLSSVDFAPFSILVYNRELQLPTADPDKFEVSNEVMLQIRRAPRFMHDDVGSIPLTAIPSLVMMLEEVAKSAMIVNPLRKQQQPAAPPAIPPRPPQKQSKRKAKKHR